jgi:hypothetical protein
MVVHFGGSTTTNQHATSGDLMHTVIVSTQVIELIDTPSESLKVVAD